MPAELERALLCERLNWTRLPHELDEADVNALKVPLYLLSVYRVQEKADTDLKKLEGWEVDMVQWLERWRQGR